MGIDTRKMEYRKINNSVRMGPDLVTEVWPFDFKLILGRNNRHIGCKSVIGNKFFPILLGNIEFYSYICQRKRIYEGRMKMLERKKKMTQNEKWLQV